MSLPRRCVLFVPALALLVASGSAQDRRQEPVAPEFRASTAVVTVDVVVRDSRGRLVTDLGADAFRVFENDQPHTLTAFVPPVAAARSASSATTPAEANATAREPEVAAPKIVPRAPTVIVLAFDRLSPQAQTMAVRAAETYIGRHAQTDDVMGIFSIDAPVRTLQPFTRDAASLRAALDVLRRRSSAPFEDPRRRINELRSALRSPEGGDGLMTGLVGLNAESSASGPTASGGGLSSNPVDRLLLQLELRMLTFTERAERQMQGETATAGLLSLVDALQLTPGRKTVLLFSEGLALPDPVLPRFRAAIDQANRHNITFYAVDAQGLRARSSQMQAREDVAAAGHDSLLGGTRDGVQLRELERNEDVLRMDPASGLSQLTEATGGVLIQNTNDLGRAFDRLTDDVRGHYLLSYAPRDATYDGKFRAIRVEVERPGVTVQARRGYVATPPAAGVVPVTAYEAPALAALDATPVPNAFPLLVRSVVFPDTPQGSRIALLATVANAHLTYQSAPQDGWQASLVVLARIRDAAGQVVHRLSDHYEMQGRREQLEESQRGRVLFYRTPVLPSGVYTLEVVAHDTSSGTSSVRIASLEVPDVNEGRARMSDLFVVRAAEQAPLDQRGQDNPLAFGELLLYPNAGEPVSKAATPALTFAFAIYPEGTPLGGAQLELIKGGQPIGAAPLTLDAPDARGRIQQIGRLPMDAFEPGAYELRVAVQAGDVVLTRSTRVAIAE